MDNRYGVLCQYHTSYNTLETIPENFEVLDESQKEKFAWFTHAGMELTFVAKKDITFNEIMICTLHDAIPPRVSLEFSIQDSNKNYINTTQKTVTGPVTNDGSYRLQTIIFDDLVLYSNVEYVFQIFDFSFCGGWIYSLNDEDKISFNVKLDNDHLSLTGFCGIREDYAFGGGGEAFFSCLTREYKQKQLSFLFGFSDLSFQFCDL